MAGLLDIAGQTAAVTVRGISIPVPGVSIAGIAGLMERFEDLRRILSGEAVAVTSTALYGTGPAVVSAIIAAGTGFPGDEAHEAAAGALAVGEQVDLLSAIIKSTLPDGMGNLLARLNVLAAAVGAEAGAAMAGFPNPSPSSSNT